MMKHSISRRSFLKAAGMLGAAGALAACGGSSSGTTATGTGASAGASDVPSYETLTVGTDYTDIKADLKFLTSRTDLVDSVFAGYVEQFTALYPNVTITYEGITDYESDITMRLTGNNWGQMCQIPTTVQKSELGDYFHPLCDLASIQDSYRFADNRAYGGKVYGIPSTGNAQGVVYNKAVFEKAGITELPKTPEEFLDALQKIKDNTDAIPLYTNYAAGWALTAWDAYIGSSATGDPDYMAQLPHTKDPFSKGAAGADDIGPYAVYYVLYESVKRGLSEDDPTTTDWEGSKGMMNRGEIGTMVLGSWAVTQMQDAGDNPDDVGYMPFPISVNGKQYANAASDYCYGISSSASDDEKIAAMLYIKWLTESSNFSYDQGGVPIIVGDAYPPTLEGFTSAELVVDNSAPDEEADLSSNVMAEAELMINSDYTHVQRIVEAAINGDETLDDIVADWNESWNAAVDKYSA